LVRLVQEHTLASKPGLDLSKLADEIIQANPEESNLVRKGQEKVVMRLVGQDMRESKGSANAAELGRLFRVKLLPHKI